MTRKVSEQERDCGIVFVRVLLADLFSTIFLAESVSKLRKTNQKYNKDESHISLGHPGLLSILI
jgi:hypothetical protein